MLGAAKFVDRLPSPRRAVATDVGAALEVIGDTELVVPPGDPRSLTFAIRQARAVRARRQIGEKFSLQQSAAAFGNAHGGTLL
jgi:hypothetical protein